MTRPISALKQTHTFVLLELSPAAYQEIREKMLAAEYGHAFTKEHGQEAIDMHGIAVVQQS